MSPRGMPTPAPMATLWELLGFDVGEGVEDEEVGEDVEDEDVVGDVVGRLVVVEDVTTVELESEVVAVEDVTPTELEGEMKELLASSKVPKPVEQSQVSSSSQQNWNDLNVLHLINFCSESFCFWSTLCIDDWQHLRYLLLTTTAVFGTSFR